MRLPWQNIFQLIDKSIWFRILFAFFAAYLALSMVSLIESVSGNLTECESTWPINCLFGRFAKVIAVSNIGSFSFLLLAILYVIEERIRRRKSHYEAWQVIDAAANVKTSFARIQALESLNQDGVSLNKLEILNGNLDGISLPKADLTQANLRGASLKNAKLMGADLSGANLRGVDLSNADLSQASLINTVIDSSTLMDRRWRLVWQIVNQRLTNRNLKRANLQDANLSKANLSGVDLRRANLKGANLRGALLARAKLHGTNFDGADLNGVSLSREQKLQPQDLAKTKSQRQASKRTLSSLRQARQSRLSQANQMHLLKSKKRR